MCPAIEAILLNQISFFVVIFRDLFYSHKIATHSVFLKRCSALNLPLEAISDAL